MAKTYDSTLARIAGNIASGMMATRSPRGVAKLSVELAEDIVATCRRQGETQDALDVLLAERIADVLFVNGAKQRADRLQMCDANNKDLGGWNRRAVVDQVLTVLKERR